MSVLLRLRVFRNKVLRKIFGPKGEEVTGAGEKCIMRSFIPCTLHHMVFRRMKWGGYVTHMAEKRSGFRVLVGKPGGKTGQTRIEMGR